MKLTTIKFIKLILLVLCISVITNANAIPEDECEKQLLSTQGLSASGNTISPGQTFPISLVSDKGKVEATIQLSLKKMKNTVVVDGEIKNVGNCVISAFMPVGLHPIKKGLPLSWHTLPEGLKHSSPTLKPGEFVKFFKEYSKEYAWGFNIKIGTFWLIPSDKPAENNLDACSDKAIAKQLEKIADQETKSELDACKSAEALKRVNETTLELIDKCSTKSKATELLQKDIKNNIAETNQRMKNSCENYSEAKLESSEAVPTSRKTTKTCPTTFEDKDWGEKDYEVFFKQISENKVHVEYSHEFDYPWRVYHIARFTNKIDPLKNKNWQNWTKSEWSIVLSELQDLRNNMPAMYPNSAAYISSSNKESYIRYLDIQIQGVKCYASLID